MKRFMLILLSLALLAALLPAALAEVEDEFGYVEKFTLEDGTELPVKVEYKENWDYKTYTEDLTAERIPVYTVTIPKGTASVQIYMTDEGKTAFGFSAALYSYAYSEETDALDTSFYADGIEIGDEYYTAQVPDGYDYAWELSDWSVGAILKLRVGELPTPDPVVTGDVNGDGTVTVDDAILVLRHVAGLETLTGNSLTLADANGDKAVDVNDAIEILKLIAGSANTGAGSVPTLTIE